MNLDKAVRNLRKRGFEVMVFPGRESAAAYLLENISDITVGIGGSVTVEQLGICEKLSENNTVSWHWRSDEPDIRQRAAASRVYLTSCNGIAETGEIVNIDGTANRLAGSMYDKEVVYIITGTNKFCETYEEALYRAQNVAAPKNAQRLGAKTPCAEKGDKCYNCDSPGRICRALCVFWGVPMGVKRMVVCIIEEKLGL